MTNQKNYNLITAGDAIKAFFRAYGLEDKILEAKIISLCDQVLGQTVIRTVDKISYRNHQLTISLKSAVVKQELEYNKTSVMNQINSALGVVAVKQVIIR
jgi:hypothetical protein